MDIYFQSGEFIGQNSKLFGQILGSCITAGVGVGVVFLKQHLDKRKEDKEKDLMISNLKNFLITTLTNIIEKIENQKSKLYSNIKLLEQRNFLGKDFSVCVSLKIEGIKSLSHIEIHQIFSYNQKINSKLHNEFLSNIELLNYCINAPKDFVKIYDSKFQEIQSSFQKDIKTLFQLYETGKLGIDNDQVKTLINYWSTIVKNWRAKPDDEYRTDPYVINDEITEPLRKKLIGMKNQPFLNKVYFTLNSCNSSISLYEKVNKKHIQYNNDLIKKMEEVKDNFTKVVQYLENKENTENKENNNFEVDNKSEVNNENNEIKENVLDKQ